MKISMATQEQLRKRIRNITRSSWTANFIESKKNQAKLPACLPASLRLKKKEDDAMQAMLTGRKGMERICVKTTNVLALGERPGSIQVCNQNSPTPCLA